MNDRFKFRYVFEKDFGGKTGICYKMPVFNLDDAVRSVFENKIIEYTNFGYKLIAKNQCTGLKDMNGKLIFEGDIVSQIYEDGSIHRCEVIYNNCSFQLKFVEKEKKNYITTPMYCYAINYLEHYTEKKLEVIGNIYENKELLNEN